MERIRLGDGAVVSPDFNSERYLRTTLRSLQNIFNVHRGSCLSNPELGMPDFNDLERSKGFSGAIKEIKKSIKFNIETFFPYIQSVKVEHVENEKEPLNLKFEVKARMVVKGAGRKEESVKFVTQKSGNGIIQVSTNDTQ